MDDGATQHDVACLQRRIRAEVSETFEARRSESGLTQAELGRRVGLQRERVHYWLSRPERMTLKAAARLLAGMDAELQVRAAPLPPRQPGTRA